MKKLLSLVLCIAMLLSVVSITASAADVKASSLFKVVASEVSNNKITYKVYLKAGVGISGAIVNADYDENVLKPVSAKAASYEGPDGDEYYYFSGEYVEGKVLGESIYTIAYVNAFESDLNSGSKDKPFVEFTFKVVDAERSEATVEFYCFDFRSENNSENNIANGSRNVIAKLTNKTLGEVTGESATTVKGGIKISWDKTTGADYYRIYRKTGSASFEKLVDVRSGTSYIDEDVSNNKKYTYAIRAINQDGAAAVYDKTGVSCRYLIAPKTITLSNAADGVTVKWSAVEGAAYYNVYRRTVNAGGSVSSWVSVAKNVTGKSYTDKSGLKNGTKYEYTVRTFSKDGSSAHYVYENILYVGAPSITVKSTASGVKITWSKVSGATKYKVYRKVSGGSYVGVKSLSASATSFTDTSAPNNKKLYYKVRVYNGDAYNTSSSKAVNYLKAPNASVKNFASGVKISWSKISGATKYYVYRKAGSATSWTKIATVTTDYYKDTNVKSGTKYTYTVKAYNGSFNSSYDSKGDSIYFVSAPKLSSAVSSKSGITVKWGKVSGTTGYIVYRKTGSGSYERITKITSASTVSYLDKTAKKGVTYSYMVYSYKSSYKSVASNALSCKDKY